MIEIKQEDIFVAESPRRDSSAKKHSTAKKAGSKSATKSELVDMMIAVETGPASGSELGSQEDSLERTNKSLIVPASSARKNLRHQKDLIAAKLNTRLQRLAKHKEAGDLQLERARLQIKDFYKQVKAKIDDIESKAQSDLRAHSFIRS
jgi:type I site-specific restriction endonuclease